MPTSRRILGISRGADPWFIAALVVQAGIPVSITVDSASIDFQPRPNMEQDPEGSARLFRVLRPYLVYDERPPDNCPPN